MTKIDMIRVCATCPWLTANHAKHDRKHTPEWYKANGNVGWYTIANLRRLWAGLRTGEASGMICHSSDPDSPHYGGRTGIKPGKEHECGGALLVVMSCINAAGDGRPQPFKPPMTRYAMARYVERHFFGGGVPAVENRLDEITLPWQK